MLGFEKLKMKTMGNLEKLEMLRDNKVVGTRALSYRFHGCSCCTSKDDHTFFLEHLHLKEQEKNRELNWYLSNKRFLSMTKEFAKGSKECFSEHGRIKAE